MGPRPVRVHEVRHAALGGDALVISIPDILISISAFGLSVALLPQVIDGFRNGAKVNFVTALTTTIFLGLIFVAFVMLTLLVSVIAMGLEVVLWGILTWQSVSPAGRLRRGLWR